MADETEAELVVRRWREVFEEKAHWETSLKVKILQAEVEHHRRLGRDAVATAVEALARELSN